MGANESPRSKNQTTKGDSDDTPEARINTDTPKITSATFAFTPDPAHASTWPQWPPATTGATSDQRFERSETPVTLRCASYDHVSSVTLRDEYPWHQVGAHKYSQKIPSTPCPALLPSTSDLSPSSSICESHEDDTQSDTSDSKDTPPRYSSKQKEKSKAQQDKDAIHENRLRQSPVDFQFSFSKNEITVQEWFVNNRPLLQDYADRQTSVPLGARLEVSVDEPSKFILGAFQLLVNRDGPHRGVDPSRQLGPQLIENFVDIDRWAKEYFRSRHSAPAVDSDITTLLTIVMNSFFEGQVQLIDRLVDYAFSHMRIAGRSDLVLQDFAFGFDFRMCHDLPFYTETSSRIRKPDPIRAVELPSISEPVTTSSGRQVRLTPRAQAAAEDAQSNTRPIPRRNTRLFSGQRARGRPKKAPVQPSDDPTAPNTSSTAKSGKAVSAPNTLERYPPAVSSNLRKILVLPGPGVSPKFGRTFSSQAEKGPKSMTAEDTTKPVPVENAFDSATSKQAAQPPPRITIKLPAPRKRLPASTTTSATAIRGPPSTSSNDTNNACTGTDVMETRTLRGGGAGRVQQDVSGPRGLALDRCGSGVAALSAEMMPKATPDATAAQLKSAIVERAGMDGTVAPVQKEQSVRPTIDSGPDGGVSADTTTAASSTTAPALAKPGVQSTSTADGDGSLDTLCDPHVGPQMVRTSQRKRPRMPPTLDPEHSRRNKRQKLDEGGS